MPGILLSETSPSRRDAETDILRSVFNPGFSGVVPAGMASARAVSDEFLSANEAIFGLQDIRLGEPELFEGTAQVTCRYAQYHGNLPVLDAGFQITLRKDDERVVAAINSLQYGLPADLQDLPTTFSAGELVAWLHERFDPEYEQVMLSVPRLVICEQRRIWHVNMDTAGPVRYFDVRVDADSLNGLILKDRRRFRVSRPARVFFPDPLTSSQNPALHWHSPGKQIENELEEVVLDNLDDTADGRTRLQGRWVRIMEETEAETDPATGEQGFRYRSHDRRFLRVMAYYYTDQLITWLQTLGVPAFYSSLTSPVTVNPHLDESGDNSHFVVPLSGEPYLAFGTGGTPDASDPGVIVHEFGHALHYFLLGRLVEEGPWEEGFNDFLSCVFRDRFNRHQYDRANPFPWDNNPAISWDPERRCDVGYRFDDQGFSLYDIYRKATVYASALWDIYLDIGGKSNDPEVRIKASAEVTSLYMDMLIAVGDAGPLPDLVNGLLTTDQSRTGGKYAQIIRNAFTSRGLKV